MADKIYIACGAGFSGDRFDAAGPLVTHLSTCPGPRYLVFEVLAERTIALAQMNKLKDPEKGYSPYLEDYLVPILAHLQQHHIKIVTNMGAANPEGAAHHIHRLTKKMGLKPFSIAVLSGDDVASYLDHETLLSAQTIEGGSLAGRDLTAANVYLGGDVIAQTLATGADIVLVGRTTDSALALGPLIYEFGWQLDDYDRLASGTICGHLLECGAQVTGAYFADPGFKEVPDLAHIGFPVAEISANGRFVITKPVGTGGMVTPATISEQLLYEMHDPANYLVPDVCADITQISLLDHGNDRVEVGNIKGHPPPEKLKAIICVDGGYLAETEMSYSGVNALARAKLAGDVVIERMRDKGYNGDIRMDILGAYSVLDGGRPSLAKGIILPFDADYRLRLALISPDKSIAQLLCDELQHLYCSGPAAGGGYRAIITEQMATASILLDRSLITPHISTKLIPAR